MTVVSDEPEWLGGYSGFGNKREIFTETIPIMTGEEMVGSVMNEPESTSVFSDGFIYDEQCQIAGVYIQAFRGSEYIENERYELYLDHTISIELGTAVRDYCGGSDDIALLTMTLQRMHEGHPDYSKYMNLETVFTHENFDLLFEEKEQKGNFVACVNDMYSQNMAKNVFGRKWAEGNFPAGSYDIIVYRRCSIYRKGMQVWRNNDELCEAMRVPQSREPKFVIVLDRKMDHKVPGQYIALYNSSTVHAIREEDNHDWVKTFYNIELAEKAAKEYSEQGYKAVILEWVENYCMDLDE